ncbi:hypothetical protein DIT71_03695 [Marinobacter vulgaris]|uniref:Cupin type-2 domain-containing protein n=1 Tax=Marinobacter vulgaris TaxID=1928331 RepID=A0A2V3ZMZ5_9GAMM|nr:cupin domain-containing protein [Marinobacter vulgaris]PXX92313.1 hypothetical protein DIT71_03695 [Marinobacter vulgaris]TSJ71744.1 cupin domain-containing protein [Marinobacter vulgaris]
MKALLSTVILLTLASNGWASDQIERMAVDTFQTFDASELDWQAEAILPPGAESVLLVGDPGKADVFIVLLKFPPNYPIPAHTHPFTEVLTVLKGDIEHGLGKTLNKERSETLQAGDSFVLPADHAHYLWTNDEETIVQLIATGPWDITYTDPADDPRNKSELTD